MNNEIASRILLILSISLLHIGMASADVVTYEKPQETQIQFSERSESIEIEALIDGEALSQEDSQKAEEYVFDLSYKTLENHEIYNRTFDGDELRSSGGSVAQSLEIGQIIDDSIDPNEKLNITYSLRNSEWEPLNTPNKFFESKTVELQLDDRRGQESFLINTEDEQILDGDIRANVLVNRENGLMSDLYKFYGPMHFRIIGEVVYSDSSTSPFESRINQSSSVNIQNSLALQDVDIPVGESVENGEEIQIIIQNIEVIYEDEVGDSSHINSHEIRDSSQNTFKVTWSKGNLSSEDIVNLDITGDGKYSDSSKQVDIHTVIQDEKLLTENEIDRGTVFDDNEIRIYRQSSSTPRFTKSVGDYDVGQGSFTESTTVGKIMDDIYNSENMQVSNEYTAELFMQDTETNYVLNVEQDMALSGDWEYIDNNQEQSSIEFTNIEPNQTISFDSRDEDIEFIVNTEINESELGRFDNMKFSLDILDQDPGASGIPDVSYTVMEENKQDFKSANSFQNQISVSEIIEQAGDIEYHLQAVVNLTSSTGDREYVTSHETFNLDGELNQPSNNDSQQSQDNDQQPVLSIQSPGNGTTFSRNEVINVEFEVESNSPTDPEMNGAEIIFDSEQYGEHFRQSLEGETFETLEPKTFSSEVEASQILPETLEAADYTLKVGSSWNNTQLNVADNVDVKIDSSRESSNENQDNQTEDNNEEGTKNTEDSDQDTSDDQNNDGSDTSGDNLDDSNSADDSDNTNQDGSEDGDSSDDSSGDNGSQDSDDEDNSDQNSGAIIGEIYGVPYLIILFAILFIVLQIYWWT